MTALSVAGLVLSMLASLVVGSRVLGLWWRTRKLPELLLAVATLCVGFIAYAVGTAGKILVEGTQDQRALFTLIGLSVECIGHVALVAFSWRVFRPREAWAGGLAGTLTALIAVALAGEIVSGELLRYSDMIPISGPWVPFGLAARGAAPTWMALECFHLHHKLRLRQRIGLADPLVVNRVLLWGVAIGCPALGFAVSIAHRLVYGTGLRAHVWALSTVSLLATTSAVALSLAFFPPKVYRRWLEERPGPAPRA
ncbi:MAG: hypothetical protein HYZ29_07660 [Myxococcales bacterium]|nr:hypothetical protein [Myxococcales bacterium]